MTSTYADDDYASDIANDVGENMNVDEEKMIMIMMICLCCRTLQCAWTHQHEFTSRRLHEKCMSYLLQSHAFALVSCTWWLAAVPNASPSTQAVHTGATLEIREYEGLLGNVLNTQY